MSGSVYSYLASECTYNNTLRWFKFQRRVAIFFHFLVCSVYAAAKTLDKTKGFQYICYTRISVIRYTRLAKVICCDPPIGSAWADHFNTIVKPIDTYRCICLLVCAMQYGIIQDLLQGHMWIGWTISDGWVLQKC